MLHNKIQKLGIILLAKAVIKSTFNKINKDPNNWFIVALWFGLFLCFATLSTKAMADLTYKTYAGTGARPSFPGNGGSLYYGTVLSTGTVTSLNYNWGSGYVLDSGRNERVIVNFYGYITIPDTGSQDIQFYLYADDGVYMKIDSTVVINDWNEQSAGTWNYVSTDQTLTGGQTYYIDAWWYENGGGAVFALYWDQSGSVALVPSTAYSTTEPVVVSGITSSQTTKFNTIRNKAVNGNQIYITQTGDGNTLNILQDGDDNLIIGTDLSSSAVITGDNNALDLDQIGNDNVLGLDIVGSSNNVAVTQNEDQRAILDITGSSNNVDLDQSAINYVGEHYMEVIIAGNSNNVDVDQTETGNKKLFLDIDGSNNVAVDQKGTGNHYAEITLTDSHNVDVTQDGSGDHNATINLSGNTSSITLTQDSSTGQNYYLYQNCTQASCSATVTQN
ncbi:PA14 domain-containing protein [bacterium]|nr:PA14 domain-containing protein [bacterium]